MTLASLRRAGWGAAVGTAALIVACALPLLVGEAPVSAGVTKGVKPDIVLSPQKRAYEKQVNSLLVNDLTPVAHDEAEQANPASPDQCRELAATDLLCDVYRIRVVPDPTPGASNFVQILMSWPKVASTPALPLAAVGLGDSDVPDIDMFLYENADAPVDYELVGGRSAVMPERIVFEAKQLEYDLVIRAGVGVSTGYLLQARVSNALPVKPFELLEDVSATAAPAGTAAVQHPTGDAPLGATVELALAPLDVGVDDQIAGVGLGSIEQFDAEVALPNHTRAVATADPPSAAVLVLALLALPMGAGWLLTFVMRRRRRVYVA